MAKSNDRIKNFHLVLSVTTNLPTSKFIVQCKYLAKEKRPTNREIFSFPRRIRETTSKRGVT